MNVNFCFKRLDKKSFNVPYHNHSCYELVYYYSGNGYFKIDKDKYEYSKGYFTVIPPNKRHNDVHLTDCELIYLGFILDDDESELLPGTFKDIDGIMEAYCNLLNNEFHSKRRNYLTVIENLAKNIVLEIKRHQQVDKINKIPPSETLQHALNYIGEYYLTEINLDLLASRANYSYHHFRHMFKEFVGMSPIQYIIFKRVEHAEKLLTTTDKSITKIGYLCGFPTTSLFIKQFKVFNTLTPLKYRQQHKFTSSAK